MQSDMNSTELTVTLTTFLRASHEPFLSQWVGAFETQKPERSWIMELRARRKRQERATGRQALWEKRSS